MNDSLTRVLPNSAEAERAVLGQMLYDPQDAALLAREKLTPADFYQSANGTLFQTIAAMLDREEAVDLVTVTTRLRDTGKLDEVGGAGHLTDLVSHLAPGSDIASHIAIVREKRVLRQAIGQAYTLTEQAFDCGDEDPSVLVAAAAQALTALCDSGTTGPVKSAALVKTVMENLQDLWNSDRQFNGLALGIPDLDALLLGCNAGEVMILGGFPGEGKSALANNLANNVALGGTPVLYHNLEMLGAEQTQRTLAAESSIDLSRYRPALSHESAMDDILAAAESIRKRNLWVSDGAGRNIHQIVAESRRHQTRYGCGLVVIDFLQELPWPAKCDNENQAITQNMTAIKAAAMTMRCPWLVLSQFNRDAAKNNRRPRKSDLRGSGSIEQSAHKIMLISRLTAADVKDLPTSFQEWPQPELDKLVLLDVVKARGGAEGQVLLKFQRTYTRFDGITEKANT
jgi:replicative DNA helicase